MRQTVLAAAMLAATTGPASGELETARDALEAGHYRTAMAELRRAARAGNAVADKRIGAMYALGLGVARDDRRAFEWYLRAAMKGHPGAQSGVGWYYETGRGMPAPDLVRAYMWYTLGTIGGDPDAPLSRAAVIKKMTGAQIEEAHKLVEDYRVWLYPYR